MDEKEIIEEAETEVVWEDEASPERRWRSPKFLIFFSIICAIIFLLGIGVVFLADCF
jgi:hypothetical protein